MLVLFSHFLIPFSPPPNLRTLAMKPRVEMMMESTAEYN